jgi:hypothetical protein
VTHLHFYLPPVKGGAGTREVTPARTGAPVEAGSGVWRRVDQLFAIILFEEMPHVGSRAANPLLDAADELVFLPLRIFQIVIGQITVGLLKLAFDDIPISLQIQLRFVHRISLSLND